MMKKKQDDLAYVRGYSPTELSIFRSRLDLGKDNPAHNRSEIENIPYRLIEEVILFSKAESPSGSLLKKIKEP